MARLASQSLGKPLDHLPGLVMYQNSKRGTLLRGALFYALTDWVYKYKKCPFAISISPTNALIQQMLLYLLLDGTC